MLAHLVFLVQSVRLAMDFLAQRCVVPFFISGPNLSDISLKISAMMFLFSSNDQLACLQGDRGESGPAGPAGLKGDGFLGPMVRKRCRQ